MSQRSPCPEPSKIPQLCGWKHLTAMCPQIVTALVWGRREAPFWSLSRQAQLREQEEADWERGFTLHQPGVIITAEVEQTGFCYFQGMGWQPVEEGNRLSFTYTVALDNG